MLYHLALLAVLICWSIRCPLGELVCFLLADPSLQEARSIHFSRSTIGFALRATLLAKARLPLIGVSNVWMTDVMSCEQKSFPPGTALNSAGVFCILD